MATAAEDKIYHDWLQQQELLKYPNPDHLRCDYNCYRTNGTVMDGPMMRNYFDLNNMKFWHSDIIVSSFPKSGTAWVQELVYLIVTLDFETAMAKNLDERSLYLEWPAVPIVDDNNATEQPRFFKTHLPYNLLPKEMLDKKCKIVYVSRNPKDTMVSAYHFYMMLEEVSYQGTFQDFFQLFVKDFIIYSPYANHILGYWNNRNTDNLLYITYEDLHNDTIETIGKIANFLGKSLTKEQVEAIADHCSFAQMARNPTTNYSQWDEKGLTKDNGIKYMRKGKVGDWKNYFTDQLENDFDKWFKENFGHSDIQFEYQI
jgi:hypothetical protein